MRFLVYHDDEEQKLRLGNCYAVGPALRWSMNIRELTAQTIYSNALQV